MAGITVRDVAEHHFTECYYYENSDDETDTIDNYELQDMHFSNAIAVDDMFFVATSFGWIVKIRVTDFKIEFIKQTLNSEINSMIWNMASKTMYIGGMNS